MLSPKKFHKFCLPFSVCASSTDLSVGSNVNLYECKDEQGSWIKPQFNVSTTAAEAQAISRTVAFTDNNLCKHLAC